MKALVTGATGFIGSHLVDRLLERDDTVRALARPSSDVSYLKERGVELVSGDITDSASLPAASACCSPCSVFRFFRSTSSGSFSSCSESG